MKSIFKKSLVAATVFLFSVNLYAITGSTKKTNSSSPEEISFVEKLNSALEKGSLDEALLCFDNLPAGLENDSNILGLKASLLLSAGKDKDAAVLAESLLAKEPENIALLELNVMVAKKSGNSAKKQQYMNKILALDPHNAAVYIELGSENALKKRYRDARDNYSKALSFEPNNTDALFGYGKMSYYLEKDRDAKNSFEKILKIDPKNAEAYSYLGKLESELRNYRAALEYVDKAIAIEPANIGYYFDRGSYCDYLGNVKDAEAAWQKAVSLDPDYFLGYAYLAGLYDQDGKYDKALEYYRKVVAKNPNYYYAYESLGILAWRSKNWAEARSAFMEARKYTKDDYAYALMIAATYEKENKHQECRKYTETVMKTMNRQSIEYTAVRMYHDYAGDGELVAKIQKETVKSKKGKILFYLALYFDVRGKFDLAQKYYNEIVEMKNPTFFEYRLAEWATGKNN